MEVKTLNPDKKERPFRRLEYDQQIIRVRGRTAAIQARMNHFDADLLQDNLYIGGYPYLVFSP